MLVHLGCILYILSYHIQPTTLSIRMIRAYVDQKFLFYSRPFFAFAEKTLYFLKKSL